MTPLARTHTFKIDSAFEPWAVAADPALPLLYALPTSDGHQQVTELRYDGPGAPARDARGNLLVDTTLHQGERARYSAQVTLRPFVMGRDRLDVPAPAEVDLAEDVLVPLTPEIRALADRLGQAEPTPEGKARAYFRYVRDHVAYLYPPAARGAQRTLTLGRGDCGEYASLFTALCRAARIPARPVYGWLVAPWQSTPHAWAEVWLEPYGWCPVDANLAREIRYWGPLLGVPRDPEFYFGSMDGYRLVLCRGTGLPWRVVEPALTPDPALAIDIDGRTIQFWQQLVDGRVPYLQAPYTLIGRPTPALRQKLARTFVFRSRPSGRVWPPGLLALATWCLRPQVIVASVLAGVVAVVLTTLGMGLGDNAPPLLAALAGTLRALSDAVTLLIFLAVAAGFLMFRGGRDYLLRGLSLAFIGGVIAQLLVPRWLSAL